MIMMLRKLFISSALALTAASGAIMPAMAADDHIINMQDVDIKAFIENVGIVTGRTFVICLLYTSPSPRDLSTSRMPSSA